MGVTNANAPRHADVPVPDAIGPLRSDLPRDGGHAIAEPVKFSHRPVKYIIPHVFRSSLVLETQDRFDRSGTCVTA